MQMYTRFLLPKYYVISLRKFLGEAYGYPSGLSVEDCQQHCNDISIPVEPEALGTQIIKNVNSFMFHNKLTIIFQV